MISVVAGTERVVLHRDGDRWVDQDGQEWVRKKRRRPLEKITDDELRRRYLAGENGAAIAESIGVTRGAVYVRLRRLDPPVLPPRQTGGDAERRRARAEAHAVVVAAREERNLAWAERYRAGETVRSIAETEGHKRETVYKALVKAGVGSGQLPPGSQSQRAATFTSDGDPVDEGA